MIELLLVCVLMDLPNLDSLPDVESAKVVVDCDEPTLTIVHIRDWHFIEYAEFKAEVQDEVADDQIETQYLIFAREVQEIQDQQELFLNAMAKAGHRDVWIEGLIPEFERAFIHICHAAAQNGLYQSPNPISVGAAARLFVKRQIRVHALDTDKGLRLTKPLDAAGKLREISAADVEKRENLMMQQLRDLKGVAIVVLGGAHDLSNNIPPDTKLVVVTVKGYRQASGERAPQESCAGTGKVVGRVQYVFKN
ncbi:MAG: hypothetical protein ACI92S_001599 [Planctomycetaceae bacterium]|jgi:hypothetical protein